MKTFKLLIALGALLAALALPARSAAAEYHAQSFLNVQAVYLTNTFNPTNLATAGSVGTNIVGLILTNDGTRLVVSATAGSRINPFKDVALWSLTDGTGPWNTGNTNGVMTWPYSYATLSVSWTAGSGANSAISFLVTPIYAKTSQRPRGREATATAEEWTFAFTPTASASQTLSTNVPLWRWPGAAGLRLRRAVNADTDASSQVIVEDISLNGYPP